MRYHVALIAICATLATVLNGCGSEIGRVRFSDPGQGSTEFVLGAEMKVDFWTDLDLETEDPGSLAVAIMGEPDVGLVYKIELFQNGEVVSRITCDPLAVDAFDLETKFRSIRTSSLTNNSFVYNGRMTCVISLPNAGATVVDVILTAVNISDGAVVELPESFKIKSADLVIKQR